MDFLDLDTSLKVTKANVILYSNWLVLNNTSICALDVNQRSSFIKDNIGFVESNPGAIISFLKKSALVNSDLTASVLSYLITKRKITYEEFCFIHLSKESLMLGDLPTINALTLLSKYIKYKNTTVTLGEYRTLDLNLQKIENDIVKNIRTDYFSTLLEGTGLFNFVGPQKDGKMALVAGANEIFDYLEAIDFENCLYLLNSENRFNYFASGSGGILDYLADEHPKVWNSFFPNLNNGLITEIKSQVVESEKKVSSNLPLQQIFYGAPGTGKSHTVEEVCKQYTHYRTTFHPDSDYSTFVGCYKPTKECSKKEGVELLDKDVLVARLKEYRNLYDETQAQTQFGYDYYEHLRNRNDVAEILSLASGKTFDTCIRVGMAIAERNTPKSNSSKITYSFIPQAFTQVYTEAWKNLGKDVFLVIEEINRGNCAQIFGDIFQLLDRKETGFSSYEIVADKDLEIYLCDYFAEEGIDENAPEDIKSGKMLLLPPNLHIWATMNTSDQSLFPIDSAFKRRWDWKYVPIKYENADWRVELKDGCWCKWTDLQVQLNDLIYDATESEDKMLGDWFVKADKDNVISEDALVGKIIFYLWNDVAKVDAGKLFDLEIEKHGKKRKVVFSDFYDTEGNVNSARVKDWLSNIKIAIEENGTVKAEPVNASNNEVIYSKPEYKGILSNIENKCKEQGIEYRFFSPSSANSMDIKVGDYAYSKLMISVSLNCTGIPNADVKLWIEATSKAVETRDKLIAEGAEDFTKALADEYGFSWEVMAKDAPDTENKVRGWRLRNTAISFDEANTVTEADKLFDLVARMRERFANVL